MDSSTTAFERGCRVAADLVRAGALVAAAAAAVLPLEGVIRFLVLFLGLLVPRLAGVRSPVDLLVGVTLTVAAWSSPAHWYEIAVWYDTVLHSVVPGVVAVTLHLLLIRLRLLPPLMANDLRLASIPLLTTVLGGTLALVWELYEWFGRDVLGLEIAAHYDDTIADMAAGLVSSLVAGVLLAVWARHRARTRRRTRWSAPLA